VLLVSDRPRLVDHTITFDAISPRLHHPAICSALRPASECPHYKALEAGRWYVRTNIQRGARYLAMLCDDGDLMVTDDEQDVMIAARLATLGEFIDACQDEVLAP
jgi:hypothetical protein